MSSVILIGDSHLEHCYDRANSKASVNFGYDNLKVHWEKGLDQLKNLEKLYKETLVKCGTPNAVMVVCGGYELMLTKDPKGVVNKLKAFVNYLRSSSIQFVIVGSIIERRSTTLKDEENVNREIRSTNKMLAKAFKELNDVFFINIRPPGTVKNIICDDKYHLKGELYDHLYKRLSSTFSERVLPHLSNVTAAKETLDKKMDVCEPDVPLQPVRRAQDLSMDKRLNEFKKTLTSDYERFCTKEKQLTAEFQEIQTKLDKVTKEKTEVVEVYKKLFGTDLSEEPMGED